jgi:hypothetical protein
MSKITTVFNSLADVNVGDWFTGSLIHWACRADIASELLNQPSLMNY